MTDLWSKACKIIGQENFEDFRKLTENTKGIAQLKNEKGETLLHVIAKKSLYSNCERARFLCDGIPFIKCLLEKGADINAKDDKGSTVLDLALRFETTLDTNSLLKYGAIASTMDIKSLKTLLYNVVGSLIGSESKGEKYMIPLKFKLTTHDKFSIINGGLHAYNKCKDNIPTYPGAFNENFDEKAYIQKDIEEKKAQLIDYLKLDIISHCSTDANLSLLHTIGLEGADELITSHLTEFIPNQDIFSIFAVNKGTYAPLQGYIKENSNPSEEQIAQAVGNSASTDEVIY